ASWVDVVPEADSGVLVDVALLASADGAADVAVVLAAHSSDACDRLSWWDAATGVELGVVAGRDAGSVVGMTARPEGGRDCWIGYTDHVTPPMVLRWSADLPRALEVAAPAPGAIDVPRVQVTRLHSTSKDGTSA